MDRSYLSAAVAETLGNEYGVVEAEHKLINNGMLEPGMKRQLQDIRDEDEQHIRNLEQALQAIGRTDETERRIQHGKEVCMRIVGSSGGDPIDMLRATILAKYKSADAEEMFYELCDEIGDEDICGLFETNLEEEEDHLDYLREQALLMARERLTGESAVE